MAITHTSRTGKNYYLHTGPKRGGGVQFSFSTKSDGNLADRLPDGFEVYESVNGQVYLRREMNLQDFISESLFQIAQGIERAEERLNHSRRSGRIKRLWIIVLRC